MTFFHNSVVLYTFTPLETTLIKDEKVIFRPGKTGIWYIFKITDSKVY